MSTLRFLASSLLLLSFSVFTPVFANDFDLVINHGRVIDPESRLDAVRHIGIKGGEIVAVSQQPLKGRKSIDAHGLVVTPGFVDLHTHSPTILGQHYQALDGVTTAMELEAGFHPVEEYGKSISETPLINFGASAGYVAMRMFEKNGMRMGDAMETPKPSGLKGWKTIITYFLTDFETAFGPALLEQANPEELQRLRSMLLTSLDDGALGIGLALDYFSEAIQAAEMNMIFSVAAERGAPIFVHIRRGIDGDPTGLREVIRLAKEHNASVHICHITHNAISNIELFLKEIRQARQEGIDITTEVLPYNAGSALISSAVFGRDWQTIFNISYEDVEWAATGERFTRETWDEYYEKYPDGQVIHHYLKEEWTQRAVAEPNVIIVSDLLPMTSKDKKVAPHNGAFSKILQRYVREEGIIDLGTAIEKMTLLPARRLENYAPVFKKKGRLQISMDADITIFDPGTIQSNATYQNPYQGASGIEYVIVNGEAIISGGTPVKDVYPGQRLTSTEKITP
jgi:N-acyl-D-aspartate/D-glutamate deacylase